MGNELLRSKERILAIDALRGFAVMGIILLHNKHRAFQLLFFSENGLSPACQPRQAPMGHAVFHFFRESIRYLRLALRLYLLPAKP